ncbi:hypothetical protein [Amycolatopsis sp. NPDC054798]
MKEEVCSARVQKLATKLTEQRTRQDELALLVDEAPVPEWRTRLSLTPCANDIEAAASAGKRRSRPS